MSAARQRRRGKRGARQAPVVQASAEIQELEELEVAKGDELALGLMLRDAEPGEWVLLHDDECAFDQPEGECGCSPICMQTGAKA